MAYINCGAFINGKRPRTKKLLKEVMASSPENVHFDCTALGDNRMLRVPPVGDTLVVTGPDPYNNRRWFANITHDAKTGKITVK